MTTEEVLGRAFCGADFTPQNVSILIEDGIIRRIRENPDPADQWICPAFFNAHTHIADTVATDTPVETHTLAELVAPPDGIKHRILRATSPEDLVRAMRDSMQYMARTGTAAFADFREGGVDGVALLRKAQIPEICPVILGRDGGELAGDGLGLSSAKHAERDADIVASARKHGKYVAVHAGEAGTTDIEAAFALDPDCIIHATHFTRDHIRTAAERGIPLVLCPRSNWILGAADSASRPPVRAMLDAGCTLWLGTDNVMFVPPDMLAECSFLRTVYKTTPEETLRMATGGFSLLHQPGVIEEGACANLLCINPGTNAIWTQNPALTLIYRTPASSIRRILFNLVKPE